MSLMHHVMPYFSGTDVPSMLQGVIWKTEGSEIPTCPTTSTWAAVERLLPWKDERSNSQQRWLDCSHQLMRRILTVLLCFLQQPSNHLKSVIHTSLKCLAGSHAY